MSEPTDNTPINAAWFMFTRTVRLLLVPDPNDRPLDQYLAFRDMVLALVESPEFLVALESGWIQSTDSLLSVANALLIELRAFPLGVKVAQATEEACVGSKEWRSRWLRRASMPCIRRDPFSTASVRSCHRLLRWFWCYRVTTRSKRIAN